MKNMKSKRHEGGGEGADKERTEFAINNKQLKGMMGKMSTEKMEEIHSKKMDMMEEAIMPKMMK